MKSSRWIVITYFVVFLLFVGFQSMASDSAGEAIIWSAVVGAILGLAAWLNIRRLHRIPA